MPSLTSAKSRSLSRTSKTCRATSATSSSFPSATAPMRWAGCRSTSVPSTRRAAGGGSTSPSRARGKRCSSSPRWKPRRSTSTRPLRRALRGSKPSSNLPRRAGRRSPRLPHPPVRARGSGSSSQRSLPASATSAARTWALPNSRSTSPSSTRATTRISSLLFCATERRSSPSRTGTFCRCSP